MGKAYELGLTCETRKNESTTTMPAYTAVRLCTTVDSVDLITTTKTKAYAVTQEAINPSDTGKVAICSCGGISRLKMGSTAYTTANLATTGIYIGANASNGKGVRFTGTSEEVFAQAMCVWAASDIIPVQLMPPRRISGL